jgi:carbon monoxide dehydrogenase subunit G
MRIQGQHSFAKGRREVWEALQDPQTLAATLPGVKRLELAGPDRYALTASVGIGSVKGLFDGTFAVEDKRDLESCVLRGSARGGSGTARVEASLRLSDADGRTSLDYVADATVTGPIAGVGQRMIAAASKKMATQFFEAVDRYERPVATAERAAVAEPPRIFERPPQPARDSRAFLQGLAAGFALAIAGVAVGRWSARGR